MKSSAKKRYDKALDDYLLCRDVSQMNALGAELAAAEIAWRMESPGTFYQPVEQVIQIDEAPVNEDR